jgi:ubiquinone/menaquinone biosynthesis C-methylase UbiE
VDTPRVSSFADLDAAGDPEAFVEWLDAARSLEFLQRVKRRMAELMGAGVGSRLLDVGSGTGDDVRALAAIAGPSGRAFGVDSSETMIQAARARGGPGEFLLGDAQALPFPPDTFDACRSERLLAHVGDPARAIDEMFRVVRPGGRVVSMEADFETLVVDAPDRALTRRILNGWCDELRHGWIGRGLHAHFRRHCGEATRIFPITLVLTTFESANRFWTLEAACDRMTHDGRLGAAEAVRWLQSLRRADGEGRFFCSVTGFVAVGSKSRQQ